MDDDELQDDQLDSDDDTTGGDSGSDHSAPPDSKPASKDEGKRVSDLMAMFNREQARANRLEAELRAARGDSGGADSDAGSQGDATNARISEYEEFARENARNTLFNSDPRLAAAGLSVEDITGNSLAEMRASVQKHQKVIGGIEGRLRNQILSEHGLEPDVATGQGTEKVPSFATMTDAEFAKFMQERDSRPR